MALSLMILRKKLRVLTLEKVFNPLQINLRLLWRGGPMSIPPILFCLKKAQTVCNGDREKYYQKVQFYQQTMSKG